MLWHYQSATKVNQLYPSDHNMSKILVSVLFIVSSIDSETWMHSEVGKRVLELGGLVVDW
jgi:hypothetical protein